jgi:hypothetical protein
MMGILIVNKPNINQSKVPKVKSPYIGRDIPEVFLVLIVSIAWGRNEIVVQNAAIKPKEVVSIIFIFLAR